MNGYSQPPEYRFSHDSIELGARAARLIQGHRGPLRVLDLCAGCGVVGLELAKLAWLDSSIDISVDFNEVQEVYRPHFERNCEWIKNSVSANAVGVAARDGHLKFQWLPGNYESLLVDEFVGTYDLVVSNPPYFDETQGRLPPSDFKARCRFFLDSDFATLWRVACHVLKPSGKALVLVRDLGDHGLDRRVVLDEVLKKRGTWTECPTIRGTGLILFVPGAS